MPQSSRTVLPPALTRWHEPVTSPAAPRNCTSIRTLLEEGVRIMQAAAALRRRDRVSRFESVAVKADAGDDVPLRHQSGIPLDVQPQGDRVLEELVDDGLRQVVLQLQVLLADDAPLAGA